MTRYELYIDGRQVEFPDEGISILFNRQRTDYTNPTIVRNSFTKTIKIPGTKINNGIFNEIWKLDRIQWSGAFNASKRTPFILINNGALVEKGYVKLNNITFDGSFYTYEMTLYGELGNLLYSLSYNKDTDATPLTLGDLDLGFDSFTITRDLVDTAWKRLNGDQSVSGDSYSMFDTINFAVCYDGIPDANNFDPSLVWVSVDRLASVDWKDHSSMADNFPSSYTDGDGITYTYVSTMISRMDPDDHYGKMEMQNELTPIETRDLRCYLLRPVIRISGIFDAIGEYIKENNGYELDLSDPFFSTDEFLSTWMTLPMLYDIDPNVETDSVFTKKQLFSQSQSPASYLISYCKIYGIYLDVDYVKRTLKLTRLPRFFTGETDELKVDLSKNIKINPLSFDKESYTFDYGESVGEFIKRYNESHLVPYGSKRVVTGYEFDASTSKYINNNIFRQAADAIEQSAYYRYPYAVRDGVLYNNPLGLADQAQLPTYTLFNISESGEVRTIEGEMKALWPEFDNGSTIRVINTTTSGYQFMDEGWAGLKYEVWNDGFPKVQLHSEDNKAEDGADVLLRFNGFVQTKYGRIRVTDGKTSFERETYSDLPYVQYLLSDDCKRLKDLEGKNGYYDIHTPGEYTGRGYLTVINSIPSFSRCSYNYEQSSDTVPLMATEDFQNMSIGGTDGTVFITPSENNYITRIETGSDRRYSYFEVQTVPGHKYYISSMIQTADGTYIKSGNEYDYPDLVGSTKIDATGITFTENNQLLGSIVRANSGNNEVCSMSVVNNSREVNWKTLFLVVYDLTASGLERINTVAEAREFFGVTTDRVGFLYHQETTLDFSVSEELFVPYCTVEPNIGIYDRFWEKFVSDIYSINGRVLTVYCTLPNFSEVFRKFFLFDNTIWMLSKITDWDLETKRAKAEFIKVNSRNNYLTE